MAQAELPQAVYHALIKHLPSCLAPYQQLNLRAVSKDFKHAADGCIHNLSIELVDVDTSQSPEALRLLYNILSLAVSFRSVRRLTFVYAEPLYANDPWDELQPSPLANVPLHVLCGAAATIDSMYKQLMQSKPSPGASSIAAVYIDPMLVLSEYYQQQQAGLQNTNTPQQQQESAADISAPSEQQQQHDQPQQDNHDHKDNSCSTSSSEATHAGKPAPACRCSHHLWHDLEAVYDCPADPFVVAVLLAIAPNISRITFRSQECRYWEVEPGSQTKTTATGDVNHSSTSSSSNEQSSKTEGDIADPEAPAAKRSRKNDSTDTSSSNADYAGNSSSIGHSVNSSSSQDAGGSSSSHSANSSNSNSSSSQHPSDLWFELEGEELQELINHCNNSTQITNTTATSSSSQQQQEVHLYSPWCLLQCVQLLQTHAKQLRRLEIALESLLPVRDWDWKGPAGKVLKGLKSLSQLDSSSSSGGGSSSSHDPTTAVGVQEAVAAAIAAARGDKEIRISSSSQQEVAEEQQQQGVNAAAAALEQPTAAAAAAAHDLAALIYTAATDLADDIGSDAATDETTSSFYSISDSDSDLIYDGDHSNSENVDEDDLDLDDDSNAADDQDQSDEDDDQNNSDWYAVALGDAISHCKQLQHLRIHDAAGGGGTLVAAALQGLSSLTSLDLSELSSYSDHWSYLRDPRALLPLTNLRHLSFDTAWPLVLIAGEFRLLSGLTSLSINVTAVDEQDSTRSVAHYVALGGVAHQMILRHLPNLSVLYSSHPMAWKDIAGSLAAAGNVSGLTRLCLPAIIDIWPDPAAAAAAAADAAPPAAAAAAAAGVAYQQQQQQLVDAIEDQLQDLDLEDMQLFAQEQQLLEQQQQLQQQIADIDAASNIHNPAAAAAEVPSVLPFNPLGLPSAAAANSSSNTTSGDSPKLYDDLSRVIAMSAGLGAAILAAAASIPGSSSHCKWLLRMLATVSAGAAYQHLHWPHTLATAAVGATGSAQPPHRQVVIMAPQQQHQYLPQQQQQQQQSVAAVRAALRNLPVLPNLLHLEVGNIGCFVHCRLADIAPALTCLRIGFTGEFADRRVNLLEAPDISPQVLAAAVPLQQQLALPYGSLKGIMKVIHPPDSTETYSGLAASILITAAIRSAAPVAVAAAAGGTAAAGYTSARNIANIYTPDEETKDMKPFTALVYNSVLATALYQVHWRMLTGHTALVRLECSYSLLTAGYVTVGVLRSLPNLTEMQIRMPQWVGGEGQQHEPVILSEDWLDIWQQQQLKHSRMQSDSSNLESSKADSPGNASGNNSSNSSSNSGIDQPGSDLAEILDAVLQRRHPLASQLWRLLFCKLRKLELSGPWLQRTGAPAAAVDDDAEKYSLIADEQQAGAKWFVGHMAELIYVLRELCTKQQQQQQQQPVTVQQLVVRDAEGAPEHWSWLLSAGCSNVEAGTLSDSSEQKMQGNAKQQQPLLSCVTQLMLLDCGQLSYDVLQDYLTASEAALGTSSAVLRDSAVGSRGVVQEQKQHQHEIVLAGCDGVTERECIKLGEQIGSSELRLTWLPMGVLASQG